MKRLLLSYCLVIGCLMGCSESRSNASFTHQDTVFSGEQSNTPVDIQAEVSDEVGTVIRINWRTAEPSTGWVDFGSTPDYEWTTTQTPLATEHEVLLLGMPADTLIHYRVSSENAQGIIESNDAIHRTAPLPSVLPNFEYTGSPPEDFIVVTLLGTVEAVVILDGYGRIVWYHLLDDDMRSIRAYFGADGQDMVYIQQQMLSGYFGEGSLNRVSLDGSTHSQERIEGMDPSHDFTQHPDGTLGVLMRDAREVEGVLVYTNAIVEIAPDGSQNHIWSLWEDLWPSSLDDVDANIWTYARAIDYDPNAQVYYPSFRELGSIFRIDRDTGQVDWILGGSHSVFEPDTLSQEMTHQFDFNGEELLLFVNGDGEETPPSASEVIQYRIDTETMSMEETDRYSAGLFNYALGDTSRIDPDTIHITWGVSGLMEREVNGTPVWSLQAPLGVAFGYVSSVPSLYPNTSK